MFRRLNELETLIWKILKGKFCLDIFFDDAANILCGFSFIFGIDRTSDYIWILICFNGFWWRIGMCFLYVECKIYDSWKHQRMWQILWGLMGGFYGSLVRLDILGFFYEFYNLKRRHWIFSKIFVLKRFDVLQKLMENLLLLLKLPKNPPYSYMIPSNIDSTY